MTKEEKKRRMQSQFQAGVRGQKNSIFSACFIHRFYGERNVVSRQGYGAGGASFLIFVHIYVPFLCYIQAVAIYQHLYSLLFQDILQSVIGFRKSRYISCLEFFHYINLEFCLKSETYQKIQSEMTFKINKSICFMFVMCLKNALDDNEKT